jgi:hypothetical protein
VTKLRVIFVAICQFALTAQVADPPRFSDFKVKEIFRGKRAAPTVKPDKREYPGFRAVLEDADKPPDFAGKYVISQDTCGSESIRLMIADAASGAVYEIFCIFHSDYRTRHDLPTGIEYREDSSLLIAHGCWDDNKPECGDHYFTMTRRGLQEIRWIPFSPPVQPSHR